MVIYAAYSRVRDQQTQRYSAKKMVRDMAEHEVGLSHVVTYDQIMDLEKYYAAFPALGKNVSYEWKPTATVPSTAKEVNGIPSKQQLHEPSRTVNNNNAHAGKKYQTKSKYQPLVHQNLQQRKDKSSFHKARNGHHVQHISHHKLSREARNQQEPARPCNHEESKKPYHQYSLYHHKQHVADKKVNRIRRIKVRESKPWKHLADVEHEQPIIKARDSKLRESPVAEPANNGSNEVESSLAEPPGITSEQLEFILTADLDSLLPQSTEQVLTPPDCSHIWTPDDVADEQVIEKETSNKIETMAKEAGAEGDDEELHSSWLTDYQDMEKQLSKFTLFNTDDEYDGDGLSGSKYEHLFTANPFSYMIRNESLSMTSSQPVLPSATDYSCKHCEQSYEIVLEAEMERKPTMYKSELFSHIDSRLDFDWTKYHPPPWSSYSDRLTDSEYRGNPVSCDCAYCRSRIWRRICKSCATPI